MKYLNQRLLLAEDSNKDAQTSEEDNKLKGHIMLSYQWDHQEKVKLIRDFLQKEGFEVWMDIDNMSKF